MGQAMQTATTKVVDGGRLILPANIRRAMKLEKGDSVVLELDGEELRVRSTKSLIREVQGMLKPYRTDVLASDELIAERRAEAAKDALNS
jgi:bifunctional DNA-binding transcriptional regulator/antitoxin component of YhaV-PrlF toxin-antitoxin module